jgi:hypothetical protein
MGAVLAREAPARKGTDVGVRAVTPLFTPALSGLLLKSSKSLILLVGAA